MTLRKTSVQSRLDPQVRKNILAVTQKWQEVENVLAQVKGIKPKRIQPIKAQRHMFKHRYWNLKINIIKL